MTRVASWKQDTHYTQNSSPALQTIHAYSVSLNTTHRCSRNVQVKSNIKELIDFVYCTFCNMKKHMMYTSSFNEIFRKIFLRKRNYASNEEEYYTYVNEVIQKLQKNCNITGVQQLLNRLIIYKNSYRMSSLHFPHNKWLVFIPLKDSFSNCYKYPSCVLKQYWGRFYTFRI